MYANVQVCSISYLAYSGFTAPYNMIRPRRCAGHAADADRLWAPPLPTADGRNAAAAVDLHPPRLGVLRLSPLLRFQMWKGWMLSLVIKLDTCICNSACLAAVNSDFSRRQISTSAVYSDPIQTGTVRAGTGSLAILCDASCNELFIPSVQKYSSVIDDVIVAIRWTRHRYSV